jgi:hypothetical protein
LFLKTAKKLDIKKRLLDVEKLDVMNLRVHKFDLSFEIYPWIKSRIFHKALMGNEVLQGKDRATFWTQLRSLLYGFFSFFRRYDAWAFTNSSERVMLEGKHLDKLMDPLSLAHPMKVLLVELQLFKQFKRKEVSSRYVVSRAWIIFLEELYSRIFLRKVTFEGKNVLDEIEHILDESVDVEPIIRKYLSQYRVMRFLLWLLPKPKVVFLTVSYANFGYIRAWKEAGIKVVEMQHGLIGDGHYGYVYHKKLDENQFPDAILVFGEHDQLFFEKQTAIPIKQAVSVGRYILDYYKMKAIPNKTPVRSILVSLQDSHWSTALLNFVLEVNNKEPDKYHWTIQTRRTPESVYRKEFNFPSNFEFSRLNVYEAIGKADAHLTIFSTTAIESISIGKPTFLFNYEGASDTYLGQFLSSNSNAYFCSDVQSFIHICANLKCKDKDQISDSNNSNISADYLENMSVYLKKLMHEVVEK